MKPLYSVLLWLLLCAPAGAEALQWYAVPAEAAPSVVAPAVRAEPASAAAKPLPSSAQRYRPPIWTG